MSDLQEKLEKLEKVKNDKAKAEGSLEQLMNQLKDKFGYTSFEEAENGLVELQEKITEDEIEFNALVEKIEKSVDWDSL